MLRRTAVVVTAAVPLLWLLVVAPTAQATSVSVHTNAHTATARTVSAAVLRLPSAATDVAVYWRGASDARVSLAFSRDGLAFAQPVDAGRDEVGEQRHNGLTYGALRAAGGAVAVRVVSDRVLPEVWVLGLADGATTVIHSRGPATAQAAVAQPTVISRSGWGADESLRFDATGKEIWPPTFFATKKLIVHHTDTPNGETDPASVQSRIRSIYYYHAVTQGWGDIGYNFLIDETGKIYEGRHSRTYSAGVSPSGDDTGGRGVTGAHTSGWNSGTLGVALLGTLTNQDATAAAKSALEGLLAWESDRNAIDPQGSSAFTNPVSGATTTTPNIGGHRDYGATECPGGVFYAGLPGVRNDVAARVASSSPPPPAPDTSPPTAPTGLVATAGYRSASLLWNAATDDIGVTGYEVFRSTGSGSAGLVGTSSTTSYAAGGLKSGRTYTFQARAFDAAGNRGPFSTAVSVTAK